MVAWLCSLAVSAVLLAPAMADVITIDEHGISHSDCTAAQNGRVAAAHRSGPAAALAYRSVLERAGQRYKISPDLLDALARQESHYDPGAVSAKGAIGIMQLMPATARAFGIDPSDPTQNIFGGAAYLRYLLDNYDGRIDLALGAYNAGQGAITRYGGLPPYQETRAYLSRNFEDLARKSDAQGSQAMAAEPAGYIQPCRR